MFFHRQELQFASKPDKPDAVYARKLQEVLGGQYGEITIAMQYMFQGWNMHTPGKYRDLVFGIASEEGDVLFSAFVRCLRRRPARRQHGQPVAGGLHHGQRQPPCRLPGQRQRGDAGTVAGRPALPHDRRQGRV